VFSASPMPTSKRQTGTTVDRIYDEATTGWGPSEAGKKMARLPSRIRGSSLGLSPRVLFTVGCGNKSALPFVKSRPQRRRLTNLALCNIFPLRGMAIPANVRRSFTFRPKSRQMKSLAIP
jgi:hypothetical protein